MKRESILEIITIIRKKLNTDKKECLSTAMRAIHRRGTIIRIIEENIISVFDFINISKLILSVSGVKYDNNVFIYIAFF
jgi:hypothetical protein